MLALRLHERFAGHAGRRLFSIEVTKHRRKMATPSESCFEIKLPCTDDPFNHGMDAVIDVRTPLEFADDHIPNAINLPVLTNEERHTVGLEYSQNSFEARRSGASLISSNISGIISKYFMDKPKSCSYLVYCWRGGQRSKSLALILTMIGYNVKCLKGGYKAYRSQVVSKLSSAASQFEYKIIGGMTGSGKTLLLHRLESEGEQVLDLEALANHKGSVLGINYDNEDQPSTKWFETCLLQKLESFDPSLPVWVEAEGRRIGGIQIPDSVFLNICKNASQSYIIESPIQGRVKYIMEEYVYLVQNTTKLKENLQKLAKLNAPIKRWFELIDDKKFEEFVHDILKNHYDPLYKKSHGKSLAKSFALNQREVVPLEKIDDKHVQNVLHQLLGRNQVHSLHI